MKKTKRFLALFLTLAMALSISMGALAAPPPPASAPDPGAFYMSQISDADQISPENYDAVSALVALGIVGGSKEGDSYVFNPQGTIDRAGLSKLAWLTCALLTKEGAVAPESSRFTDVSMDHWALPYIEACAREGMINGSTPTTFDPNGTATLSAVGKLMLAAMGRTDLVGDDWMDKTEAAGDAIGLFANVGEDLSAPATREETAQIIYNALTYTGDKGLLAEVLLVKEDTTLDLTVKDNTIICAPAGKLVSVVCNGAEIEPEVGKTYQNAKLVVTAATDMTGSFYGAAHPTLYPFRTALMVEEGRLVADKSVTEAISGGTYNDSGVTGATIQAGSDEFSGVLVKGGEYTISDTDIIADTDADGSRTNDFSGLGAAVMAAGEGTRLTIEDSSIETTGVAKLALFSDQGADVIVKNSVLKSNSGTIYDGYMSTADQAVMVAPPWVLGISGNARTTNLMGDMSTSTFIDSTIHAKNWGALSTDSGSWMHLTTINSDVIVDESGYGAYNIGEATEHYYGTRFDVDTMAIIMTGGRSVFQSYTGGQEIDVYKMDGLDLADKSTTGPDKYGKEGTLVGTFVSEKVPAGQKVVSKIDSDNFGFECHANGTDNTNTVELLDGTEVNTGHAVFLVKKVSSDFVVDGAKLNPKDGVILQMMDNDDDFVGIMPTSNTPWGQEDVKYEHHYATHMPTFNTSFVEEAGWGYEWSTYDGQGMERTNNWVTNISFDNGDYTGNLYNGTGYTAQAAALNVTIKSNATLNGAISATATQHEVKEFTSANPEHLGHVINTNYYNGYNDVTVTVEEGAVWNVTETGIVTQIVNNGTINGTITENADGTYTVAPLA